ncbi:MAG: ABC transporter ATP-binding protein [Kiritimatiellae bacterium]|nr:ABC transporter ATP-binding protein [Kiritimatiellia bacterium]
MDNILEVRDLKVHYPIRKGVFSRIAGYVKALDGVSFDLRRGETLGVVGESGSGKSTLARVITGLVKPTGGTFKLDGSVAMVFQDPLGSLNPRMTVREILREVTGEPPEKLLETVGLPVDALGRYPHEFSGGQRQRICIARAVAVKPQLLICDEAVSALDLSVRSQVLELVKKLKDDLDLSVLFITHDIGVVNYIADSVLVMNCGRIVEQGGCREVLHDPQDDYTRRLIAAVPRIRSDIRQDRESRL